MRRRTFLGGVAAVAGVGLGSRVLGGSTPDSEPTALVAGSLQALADRVPTAAVEAHGSVAVRRLVVDGLRSPDAVAMADPALFDGISDRMTLFATNALVLVYRPDSTHADALRSDWRAAIRAAEVGRTDPELDPLGYRTVMAVELDGRLDRSVLDGTRLFPETGLLRTLEAGGLDAAFAYRNMAVEHDLPYVELPDSIDFSTPALADHYRRATVDLGDRVVRGRPIRYGAAALTERGQPWVDALTEDRERLETAGFGVPESYPRRTSLQEV